MYIRLTKIKIVIKCINKIYIFYEKRKIMNELYFMDEIKS
jgi:hypothetical protein